MTLAEGYLWSNDFWNTFLTVLAAVMVGGGAIWAALYAVNPKKRLIWRNDVNEAIIPDGVSTLSVLHAATPVGEPRLVDLQVKNNGRRDIEPGWFSHDTDALIFDLGTTIVHLVDVSTFPSSTIAPGVTYSGSKLHLHKSLIAKDQRIKIVALVDGPEGEVKCHAAGLLNVKVPVKPSGEMSFRTTSARMRGQAAFYAPLVATIAVAFVFSQLDKKDKRREQDERIASCLYLSEHDPGAARKACPAPKKP
nr:hypothetical protein OG296_30210 [Streptomyces sp. NBC_01001]